MAPITPLPEDRSTVIPADVAAANAADSKAMMAAFLLSTAPQPNEPPPPPPPPPPPAAGEPTTSNVHSLHTTTKPAVTTSAPTATSPATPKRSPKRPRENQPDTAPTKTTGTKRTVLSLPHTLATTIGEYCAATNLTKTEVLVTALESTWDSQLLWYSQPSGRFPASAPVARSPREPMRHSEFPLTLDQVQALDERISELGAPSRSEFVTRVLEDYLLTERAISTA